MPAIVERNEKGKWRDGDFRIKPGDRCPGASDYGDAFHDLVFQEFETLRAFPGSASSLDSKPSTLVEALVMIEFERQIVVNWLEMREEQERRNKPSG